MVKPTDDDEPKNTEKPPFKAGSGLNDLVNMKKLVFIVLFMFVFTVSVTAEAPSYLQQYEKSGAGEIWELLDKDTANIVQDLGIDPSDAGWVNQLSPQNVFSNIWSFVKGGAKGPLKVGFTMLAILLIMAAASTFEALKLYEDAISYVFALAAASVLIYPLASFILTCGSTIKGITTLMTGFVPIYAGIITASGKGLTASGMSFLLLSASSAVSSVASFIVLPMMNCYLGVGLAGSVMPLGGLGKLNDGIKKVAVWTLSLTLTVFLGILSIQSGINRAADGLGVKTARFMIGSFVPVAGGALSESLTALLGSLSLLKTSVGMFGAVAVAAIVLPTLMELLLWRASVFILGIAADVLGVGNRTEILRAVDCVLSVMVGILLFTGALFIISLAIVAGG